MLQSLFNDVKGLNPAILLKKRLQHKCFPVNFSEFFKTLFGQNTSDVYFWKVLEAEMDSESKRVI